MILYFLVLFYTDTDGVATSVMQGMQAMTLAECLKIADERTATARMTTWAARDVVYHCVPNRPLPEREA